MRKKQITRLLLVAMAVCMMIGCGRASEKEKVTNSLFYNDKVSAKSNNVCGFVDKEGVFTEKKGYEEYYVIPEYNWCKVKKNGLWGAEDLEGNELVKAEYANILYLNSDEFIVEKNDGNTESDEKKYGIVNRKNQVVVNPEYDISETQYDCNVIVMTKDGKNYYFNRDGKKAFDVPNDISVVSYENNKLFKIKENTGKVDEMGSPIGKDGLMDIKGNIVVSPKYEEIMLESYNEGMIPFTEDGEKWGYINEKGEVIIAPQYSEPMLGYMSMELKDKSVYLGPGCFVNGLAVVELDSPGAFSKHSEISKITNGAGVVDKKGNYIIQPKYENLKLVDNKYCYETEYTWGFINKDGKMLSEFDKEKGISVDKDFKNGISLISKVDLNGETIYGLINDKNKIVLDCEYQEISINDGKTPINKIKQNDRYGYVDNKGKIIVKPQYTYGSDFFDDGYAHVIDESGHHFIIDKNGKVIVDNKDLTEINGIEKAE